MRDLLLLPLFLGVALTGCVSPWSDDGPSVELHGFVATYEEDSDTYNDVVVSLSAPIATLDADGDLADLYQLTIKESGLAGAHVCGIGAGLLVHQCSLVCMDDNTCDGQFQAQFTHRGLFPPAGMLLPLLPEAPVTSFGHGTTLNISASGQVITLTGPADAEQVTTLPGEYDYLQGHLAPEHTRFPAFDPDLRYTLRSYEPTVTLDEISTTLTEPEVRQGPSPALFPGATDRWFDMPEAPEDVIEAARSESTDLDAALQGGCVLEFAYDHNRIVDRTDLVGFKSQRVVYDLIVKDRDGGLWAVSIDRTAYEYDGSIEYETEIEQITAPFEPACHEIGPALPPQQWIDLLVVGPSQNDGSAVIKITGAAPGAGYADGHPELWRYILTWRNDDPRLEPNRIIYNPHTQELWQVTALNDLYGQAIL